MKRGNLFRNLIICTLILAVFWYLRGGEGAFQKSLNVAGSTAREVLEKKEHIEYVEIGDRSHNVTITLDTPYPFTDLKGHKREAKKIVATFPEGGLKDMYKLVKNSHAKKWEVNSETPSVLASLFQSLLPTLIMVGLLIFFLSSMLRSGGKGGLMGIGKSRAKKFNKDMTKTTFADVAGAEEAVEELEEIRDFLQNPQKYESMGAKIPRGVLLYGPPGTGKTLLARAVAGEAGVPFFHVSGSDFIEMFAGVGSARIRDLFEQAKKENACIIFIDELDAIGRKRGSGSFGGNDEERHQTLNQILVEMDGFEDRGGIIIMGATNRPDSLDPALLRPGRFDRQIPVNNPNKQGRKDILTIHAKNKPFASDAQLDELAKRTIGMSGAELENVLNEAALLTVREGKELIDWASLNEAIDRVQLGPRKRSRIISEREKKVAAYHEAGHTLTAWVTPGCQPVYKVTIVQRGATGGHAMTLPDDDKLVYTRTELLGNIVMSLGGRVAEELVFGEQTTGASADIEQASKTARAMVTEYGMSVKVGPILYGRDEEEDLFGQGGYRGSDYSPGVASTIDMEVYTILESARDEAWGILTEHRDVLDHLVEELMDKETLLRPDLEKILGSVPQRPRLKIFNDFGKWTPDTRQPVLTPNEKKEQVKSITDDSEQ